MPVVTKDSTPGKRNLDQIDFRILQALQEDGHITNARFAERAQMRGDSSAFMDTRP